MLGVLVTILTVILVVICLLMSLVILMQRPKQEGLGAAFGGALTDRMLGSGTTDFLQKATVFMGVAFFLLSLTIATLMAYDRNADRLSQVEQLKQTSAANAEPAEETVVPATGDGAAPEGAPPAIDLGGATAPEINLGGASTPAAEGEDEGTAPEAEGTAPEDEGTAAPEDIPAPEEATENDPQEAPDADPGQQ